MKDSELRMIETMLKKQDELNSAIMKEFGLTTISKEQIDLATLDEIGEFTHELKGDWCWWKKSQEPVDRNKALEELTDVFHFVLIYELFYGSKSYLTDSKYDRQRLLHQYQHSFRMNVGFGLANALIGIIKLEDGRLMYLLAVSDYFNFSLEEVCSLYEKERDQYGKVKEWVLMDMDIELIVEIVMLFGVYIVAGMIISYIVNDISYLAYDYFWLVTILYPIILPIFLYFELKRFVKELKENSKR